eukprot:2746149-Amphidinium_carterae.1
MHEADTVSGHVCALVACLSQFVLASRGFLRRPQRSASDARCTTFSNSSVNTTTPLQLPRILKTTCRPSLLTCSAKGTKLSCVVTMLGHDLESGHIAEAGGGSWLVDWSVMSSSAKSSASQSVGWLHPSEQ